LAIVVGRPKMTLTSRLVCKRFADVLMTCKNFSDVTFVSIHRKKQSFPQVVAKMGKLINRVEIVSCVESEILQLASLPHLEYAHISMFPCTVDDEYISPSVQGLELLTNLKVLSFQSSPGLRDISPVSQMTSLVSLNLTGSSFYDTKMLQFLTNLRKLSLGYCSVYDISPLKNLTKLESLHIFGTQLYKLDGIEAFVNLTSLNMAASRIKDISLLSTLPKLKKINITRSDVSDLTPLKTITTLERLKTWRTQNFDQKQVAMLQKELPRLIITVDK